MCLCFTAYWLINNGTLAYLTYQQENEKCSNDSTRLEVNEPIVRRHTVSIYASSHFANLFDKMVNG